MKIGSRVLVNTGKGRFRLGIVTHGVGNTMTVTFDSGVVATKSVTSMRICLYFAQLIKNEVDQDWLDKYSQRIKPADYDMKTFFLLKKSQICSLPLITSMWYYANSYVFQSKLQLPMLKAGTPKKSMLGLYQYRPSGDTIYISKVGLPTCKEIWGTLVHEMVHQYNYRIDWLQEKTFDPNSGGHGRTFMRWQPIVKELAGVPLSVKHDSMSVDVDNGIAGPAANPETVKRPEDEHETDVGTKVVFNYIFLATFSDGGKDYYIGCKAKDLEVLKQARNFIKSRYGMGGKYSTRKLANVPLLNLITSTAKGTTNTSKKLGGYYYTFLSEKVYDAILKAAVSLESI